MPIGIKNSTDGDVQIAVDGARASAESHVFMGINPDGLASLITTTGNPDCHVILRGGSGGPNYSAEHVSAALGTLTKAGLPERLIVDASHGNSGKDHRRQPVVAADLASRIADARRSAPTWSAAAASPTPAWTGTPRPRCSTASPPRSAPAADHPAGCRGCRGPHPRATSRSWFRRATTMRLRSTAPDR
ncbi:MAG: hypothetical protein ABS81_18050 [Pseudonocardia sp. SCN 72-86]|nr:MAG: hypothetical protein ABS81_18050 [Pseudonocardia sp. SCN 72-86]